MSFQAYLDTIKIKTGKSPDDFIALARKKGLLEPGVKAGQIVAWLKEDFGLGHGNAMAIVDVLKSVNRPRLSVDEQVARHFSGSKAGWRKAYDALWSRISKFGKDIEASPTSSYISLLRKDKKFAIVQSAANRLDIGLKLKGAASTGRLEAAGPWNNTVTHRVRIGDPTEINTEVLAWLKQAYEAAGSDK